MTGVPGYALEAVVGQGSMGTVWRARQHASDGRVVALKRVPGDDPALVARLRREGQVLARLDHPHVVRVFEIVADGDGVAVAMQFAAGGSLAGRGRLTTAQVVAVLAPVAEALASAHRLGVLHRDVKPSNILFTSDGEPLLGDFGIARSPGARLTAPDVAGLGTAEYLDPAVAAGAEPDARSDIYALGVVAYEALAGVPPFTGPTPLAVLRAADAGAPLPLDQAAPGVPPALATAVHRALSRDPTTRHPDAASFAVALRAALPGHARPLPRAGRFARGGAVAPNEGGRGGRDDARAGAPEVPAVPVDARGSPHRGPGNRDGGTREFGPRPPRAQPGPQPRGRARADRWALVGVVALGLLLGPVLGVWMVRAGAGTTPSAPAAAGTQNAGAPDAGGGAPVVPGGGGGCDVEVVPVAAAGETVLNGDLDGDGCASWVRWRDGVLEAAPDPGAEARHFELGTAADRPLLGDWDCDGRATPALYRPATGEVFLFDDWAAPGGDLRSRAAIDTGTVDGTARVTRTTACDTVEVEP